MIGGRGNPFGTPFEQHRGGSRGVVRRRQPLQRQVIGAGEVRLRVIAAFELRAPFLVDQRRQRIGEAGRSEEHTSELQSLMRISYAVFCLKKKTENNKHTNIEQTYIHDHKYLYHIQ